MNVVAQEEERCLFC